MSTLYRFSTVSIFRDLSFDTVKNFVDSFEITKWLESKGSMGITNLQFIYYSGILMYLYFSFFCNVLLYRRQNRILDTLEHLESNYNSLITRIKSVESIDSYLDNSEGDLESSYTDMADIKSSLESNNGLESNSVNLEKIESKYNDECIEKKSNKLRRSERIEKIELKKKYTNVLNELIQNI